jgi:prevent-host-death family protein
MQTVNMHEAKTHLSRLVEQAVNGQPFVIARAGKPLVKVISLATPDTPQARRLGFMKGEIRVPDDFDRMGSIDIEQMFAEQAFTSDQSS